MTVKATADKLLEVLTDAFTAAGRLPKRQYVSNGTVVYDWTPVLAIEWERSEPNMPWETGQGAGAVADMSSGIFPMRAVFSIHVTRDAPFPDEVGTPPQKPRMEASADEVFADAALVIDTLLARMGDGTLAGHCGRMWFIAQTADALKLGPHAGVAGSVTQIAVAL